MQKDNIKDKTLGIFYGILSAVFVAGYLTTNKYIYSHHDITAFEYSLIFAMSGAIYALASFAFQINKPTLRLVKKNFLTLVTLSLAGSIAVATFTIGLRYTTAVNASLLATSTIVSTALFSHAFLKERHSKQQYIWIVLLFIGLYIGVVGFHTLRFRSGDLIVLASIVFFGFGNAYSRLVMKRFGSARLVPDMRLIIGGTAALALSPFIIRSFGVIRPILPAALLAGLFYWLCMKTFAKTNYLINANNAVVLNNSQIFFTSIAGVLILSEHYSLEKLTGSLLAIIAIYFIAKLE